MEIKRTNEWERYRAQNPHIVATRSLVYKGWLIRDAFQRLLEVVQIFRDEV